MVQGASQIAGRFPEELRMYKAPPPEVSSEPVLMRPTRAAGLRVLQHSDSLAAPDRLGRACARRRTFRGGVARVHA